MNISRANITGWKWRFTKSQTFIVPFYYHESFTLESNSGNVLVALSGNILLIERHYHFNGITWLPDFKKVLSGLAVYDAMVQLSEKYPDKVKETDAHEAFDQQMQRDGFKLRRLYYWAVTSWPGKLYKNLTR